MVDVFPGPDGQRPFTGRVLARRVGGAALGAPFLSLLDGVALARPPGPSRLRWSSTSTTAFASPPTTASRSSCRLCTTRSSPPGESRGGPGAACGDASIFERVRRAMDGEYPERQGHRPPRARRRAGTEQHPPHDAPPELPRAAASARSSPPRGARLSGSGPRVKRPTGLEPATYGVGRRHQRRSAGGVCRSSTESPLGAMCCRSHRGMFKESPFSGLSRSHLRVHLTLRAVSDNNRAQIAPKGTTRQSKEVSGGVRRHRRRRRFQG